MDREGFSVACEIHNFMRLKNGFQIWNRQHQTITVVISNIIWPSKKNEHDCRNHEVPYLQGLPCDNQTGLARKASIYTELSRKKTSTNMVDLWNHADQMASGQVTMLLELQFDVGQWMFIPKNMVMVKLPGGRCGAGFSIARGLSQHMLEDGSTVTDSCLFSFLVY